MFTDHILFPKAELSFILFVFLCVTLVQLFFLTDSEKAIDIPEQSLIFLADQLQVNAICISQLATDTDDVLEQVSNYF